MSKTDTFMKMDDEGRLHHKQPDGTLERIEVPPVAPMSAAEIEAAAMADTDNPPLTPEREARLRRVPRTKSLRRALGLTE